MVPLPKREPCGCDGSVVAVVEVDCESSLVVEADNSCIPENAPMLKFIGGIIGNPGCAWNPIFP